MYGVVYINDAREIGLFRDVYPYIGIACRVAEARQRAFCVHCRVVPLPQIGDVAASQRMFADDKL